jgi:hypothetical protein
MKIEDIDSLSSFQSEFQITFNVWSWSEFSPVTQFADIYLQDVRKFSSPARTDASRWLGMESLIWMGCLCSQQISLAASRMRLTRSSHSVPFVAQTFPLKDRWIQIRGTIRPGDRTRTANGVLREDGWWTSYIHQMRIYCIFASCYIRLTLNICSFVNQCNTLTSYFLIIVDMFRPHTAIFRCHSILSRSWCSVMPIFAYVMLPAMCFSWCCAY